MRRFFLVAAGVVALIATGVSTGGATQAGDRWVITDLGTLGGKESYAAAINSKGQVVGWAKTKKGKTHPFLWQDGRMRDLGTLGYPSAWATDINERGQVVGQVVAVGGEDNESAPRGFLWDRGTMAELWGDHDTFADEAAYSVVRMINDRGRIVGWAHTPTQVGHALSWVAPAGKMPEGILGLDLNKRQDDDHGDAYDVNERGQSSGREGACISAHSMPSRGRRAGSSISGRCPDGRRARRSP